MSNGFINTFIDFLQCPICRGEIILLGKNLLKCSSCDKKYKIHMLSAGNFLDDTDDCKNQMSEIDKNLMNNFSDINREIKEERNHPADLDAKINSIYYYFPSGGGFRVSCFDWSKRMQTEKNWYDHIKVSGFTEEILQWFINEAY